MREKVPANKMIFDSTGNFGGGRAQYPFRESEGYQRCPP